jgi:hypothetical protein
MDNAIATIGKRKLFTIDPLATLLGVVAASHGPRPVQPQNQLPDPIEEHLDSQMRPGGHVVAESDGRTYQIKRLSTASGKPILGTLERVTPKRRGKAARREEKRARRLAREQAVRTGSLTSSPTCTTSSASSTTMKPTDIMPS